MHTSRERQGGERTKATVLGSEDLQANSAGFLHYSVPAMTRAVASPVTLVDHGRLSQQLGSQHEQATAIRSTLVGDNLRIRQGIIVDAVTVLGEAGVTARAAAVEHLVDWLHPGAELVRVHELEVLRSTRESQLVARRNSHPGSLDRGQFAAQPLHQLRLDGGDRVRTRRRERGDSQYSGAAIDGPQRRVCALGCAFLVRVDGEVKLGEADGLIVLPVEALDFPLLVARRRRDDYLDRTGRPREFEARRLCSLWLGPIAEAFVRSFDAGLGVRLRLTFQRVRLDVRTQW